MRSMPRVKQSMAKPNSSFHLLYYEKIFGLFPFSTVAAFCHISLPAMEDKVMLNAVYHTCPSHKAHVFFAVTTTVNKQCITFSAIKYIKIFNQVLVLAQDFVSKNFQWNSWIYVLSFSRYGYLCKNKLQSCLQLVRVPGMQPQRSLYLFKPQHAICNKYLEMTNLSLFPLKTLIMQQLSV